MARPVLTSIHGSRLGLDPSDFLVCAGIAVQAPGTSAPYTVATLPSASAAGKGAKAFVTDATATTFASTVAGGGSTSVPVYSDGTNWLIG